MFFSEVVGGTTTLESEPASIPLQWLIDALVKVLRYMI